MQVTRAYAVLPVLPADLPSVEPCLEHLVAAADEASAAGIPTTLVVSTSADPTALVPVLASWTPLVDLLDDVDLTVDHHHGASSADELRQLTGTGLARTIAAPRSTVVLTTTCTTGVGPGWITEHVRHHRQGAWASTAPVRGVERDGTHDVVANLAVRAELLPDALRADGRQQLHLVHAESPVVATWRVTLRAFP
ncbi:hypothetical protein [Kineococcus sp. SYSU DK003]|uniref:hypothetical protein n=1 Tax=Kineococcus sp. SYSU DK003 TaxID=3383124 RepID=UPI003D7CAA14